MIHEYLQTLGGDEQITFALVSSLVIVIMTIALLVKTLPKARENRLEREKIENTKDEILNDILRDLLAKAKDNTTELKQTKERLYSVEEQLKEQRELSKVRSKEYETKISALEDKVKSLEESRTLLRASVERTILLLGGEGEEIPLQTKDLAGRLDTLVQNVVTKIQEAGEE